jgi:hypothetical protein
MNTKAFKRLIKEAVIDAIHEELPYILEEHMAKQEKKTLRENRTMSFTSNDVAPNPALRAQLASKMGSMLGYDQLPQQQSGLQVDSTGGNPFAAFIADAANNMTAQDKAGLSNLG